MSKKKSVQAETDAAEGEATEGAAGTADDGAAATPEAAGDVAPAEGEAVTPMTEDQRHEAASAIMKALGKLPLLEKRGIVGLVAIVTRPRALSSVLRILAQAGEEDRAAILKSCSGFLGG